MDAICHVVRCFDGTDVVHVEGTVDPVRDIETVNLELILSDMEWLDRRMERLTKSMKGGDKAPRMELDLCERIANVLAEGKPARTLELSESDRTFLPGLPLLSMKPVLYVANVAEDAIGEPSPLVQKVQDVADAEGAGIVVASAQIEEEIALLDEPERSEFLQDLGIEESGLDQIVRAGYALLGLISYLTAGPKEVRAWTITQGTKAPQAAGKIHTDFERGFIRAEVVAFTDLEACGSYAAAREKGLVRSEGKEYVFQDGDVVLFRFNV